MCNGSRSLDALFAPRSIAIIGASDRGTPSVVIGNLLRTGFPGELVLVNPGRATVLGMPCLPRLGRHPDPVDLAAIVVGPARVAEAVRGALAAGARSLAVFADVRSEPHVGPQIQDEIVGLAREAGVPLLGPNSMGYFSPRAGVALYIDTVDRLPEPGCIGVVTQSGSVGVAAINHTGTFAIGSMISVGNEGGVSTSDAVAHLAASGWCKAVAVFVEGIGDGRAFTASIRRATAAGTPVVICKTGRSPAAARAARSHTGAMANDDAVVRAMVEAAGGIVADDLDDLFTAAELLATGRRFGPRLAGLTLSGGHVGLLTDLAASVGLGFPEPDGADRSAIVSALGAEREVANPLDCWVNDDVVDAIDRAARAMTSWRQADGIVFAVDTPANPPTSYVEMGRQISETAADTARVDRRPVIMVQTAVAADDPHVVVTLKAAGVPRIASLRSLFNAWASIVRGTSRQQDQGEGTLLPATAGFLPGDEAEAYRQLDRLGISVPRHAVCGTIEDARAAAERLGYPLVAKVLSAGIPHKTELGGVVTGLSDAEAVERAVRRLLAIPAAEGVLLAEHIDGGVEAFVGGRTDGSFGPVVVVGTGGIHAELLSDRVLMPARVSVEAVEDAIAPLRLSRLLAGYRGQPAVGTRALADVVARVGAALAASDPSVVVDLNPVRLLPGRAIVLDAKIARVDTP